MKKLNATLVMVLLGASLAFAAGLIPKETAEKEALNAVGGGTVLQATLDSDGGKKVWSIDIARSTNEFEVRVDARSGVVLKVITQSSTELISSTRAEQDALAVVGGGEVLQTLLEPTGKKDDRVWRVDILGSNDKYEVSLDARSGTILKIITQPLNSMAPCTFVTKAKAEKIALAAIHGGTVILAVLEKNDTPPNWSVDLVASNGAEYEVKVNACTGKVIAIIVGG
jgi:uncharacterized membrane protein YkoI